GYGKQRVFSPVRRCPSQTIMAGKDLRILEGTLTEWIRRADHPVLEALRTKSVRNVDDVWMASLAGTVRRWNRHEGWVMQSLGGAAAAAIIQINASSTWAVAKDSAP